MKKYPLFTDVEKEDMYWREVKVGERDLAENRHKPEGIGKKAGNYLGHKNGQCVLTKRGTERDVRC